MPSIRFIALQSLLLLLPLLSFAGTGILEVRSEPSGAHIWIDDRDAGVTPYQNFEASTGKRLVKAMLNPAYPPQIQEVVIDERTPQVILFKFMERSKGAFTGREIVRAAYKYQGDVTFASIPTGALVILNGEPLVKPAPVGYTDVEVGRYTVEFRLEGRTLRAEFDVVQGEPAKLIADFNADKVINRREEGKQQETAKREQEKGKREQDSARKPPQALPAAVPVSTASAAVIPAAVPVSTRPQPVEGAQPYGELVILVNARRDANLAYSDYFDIALPKLPIDSLSGPLFPAPTTTRMSSFKDNFEYKNDSEADTRQVSARVHFGEQDSASTVNLAKSCIITVREGTYDLKIARLRLLNHFTSVQKLLDETGLETIEIIRGNRLVVQIDSHIDADHKLHYQIVKTYELPGKTKQPAGKQYVSKTPPASSDLPVFGSIQN